MFAREDRDDIAVIRMAYGKVSALDSKFCENMAAEIERLELQPVGGVVITGTGSAFSAGVDLHQLLNGGVEYVRHFLPLMERLFRALLVFPKPLVAAVNGHAIAGGCIMAAAADHRVMARGPGRIGVPELLVGVPFPRLPLEMIAARLSPAILRQVIYTGRTVHADDAVAMGFVDEAVEANHLLDRAVTVARELSAIPPRTFALTKRALTDAVLARVRASADGNIDVVEAWLTPAVHEAIRRYIEKTIGRG